MKMLIYKILQSVDENSTVLSDVFLQWSEENEKIAIAEAYNGEYYTEDITIPEAEDSVPIAPGNVQKDEYVSVNGVLYRAIMNIPNGEPIIIGQNAVKTTIEEQLNARMKGE